MHGQRATGLLPLLLRLLLGLLGLLGLSQQRGRGVALQGSKVFRADQHQLSFHLLRKAGKLQHLQEVS